MTEIPEHLLKRSKERKAAISGESTEPQEAPTTSAAVEPAQTAAPAPQQPEVEEVQAEVVEKVAPYIEVAQSRKKMPYWVVPVLLTLPVWALMYVGTLERVPQGLTGLLGEGEELYVESGCAGCHGGEGGGGIGPAFADGEVHVSFTSLEDQIVWIAKGSTIVGTGNPYTSADSERPRLTTTGMPGFGSQGATSLHIEEIIAVTLYERTQFEPGDAGERDLQLAEQLDLMLETGELQEALAENDIDLDAEIDAATLTPEIVASWVEPAREALAATEG